MDFFVATRALEWYANSRGSLNASDPSKDESSNNSFAVFSVGGVVAMVIGALIGFVAAYLSWSCNTALSYNVALKVVFAVLAFTFGILYILLYMIMRYDTCSYIKRTGYY